MCSLVGDGLHRSGSTRLGVVASNESDGGRDDAELVAGLSRSCSRSGSRKAVF